MADKSMVFCACLINDLLQEAGVPSGAVLSIMNYLSTQDTSGMSVFGMASIMYAMLPATRIQYQGHQQPSYYQFPVQHTYHPNASAYTLQPAAHSTYLQQQPHPLAAATQFTSIPSSIVSYQMSSMPAASPSHQLSQQVLSPVGIASPTHPASLIGGWTDGSKMTQVATGQRP